MEGVLKALPDGCVKTGRYVHTVHRYFDDASKSRIKVKTTETKKAATGEQTKEKFDHVIFACHAHQALAMIGKKRHGERVGDFIEFSHDEERGRVTRRPAVYAKKSKRVGELELQIYRKEGRERFRVRNVLGELVAKFT